MSGRTARIGAPLVAMTTAVQSRPAVARARLRSSTANSEEEILQNGWTFSSISTSTQLAPLWWPKQQRKVRGATDGGAGRRWACQAKHNCQPKAPHQLIIPNSRVELQRHYTLYKKTTAKERGRGRQESRGGRSRRREQNTGDANAHTDRERKGRVESHGHGDGGDRGETGKMRERDVETRPLRLCSRARAVSHQPASSPLLPSVH